MSRTARIAFLALVLVQACHSVEEYFTRLFDVLPPARFVSELISTNRSVGFAIANAALLAFGLSCFFGPVQHSARSAVAFAWFWVVLECLNGLAHLTWAVTERAYRPGAASAPMLLTLGVFLGWHLQGGAGITDGEGPTRCDR